MFGIGFEPAHAEDSADDDESLWTGVEPERRRHGYIRGARLESVRGPAGSYDSYNMNSMYVCMYRDKINKFMYWHCRLWTGLIESGKHAPLQFTDFLVGSILSIA